MPVSAWRSMGRSCNFNPSRVGEKGCILGHRMHPASIAIPGNGPSSAWTRCTQAFAAHLDAGASRPAAVLTLRLHPPLDRPPFWSEPCSHSCALLQDLCFGSGHSSTQRTLRRTASPQPVMQGGTTGLNLKDFDSSKCCYHLAGFEATSNE